MNSKLLVMAVSLVAAAGFGLASAAGAATLPLYNTGQGLSGGASDPHWSVQGSSVTPGPASVLSAGNMYSAWAADSSQSSWIGACDCYSTPAPPYTFTESFSLTGYNLSTAVISGVWGIDDSGSLDVNGHVIGTESDTFSADTPFTVPVTDLNSGLNTINITMTSDDRVLDGVRLQFSQATAVSAAPEPSSWALIIFGVGLIGVSLRRRGHEAQARAA